MRCSERGFTMIELMIAVFILAVGMLGLFQSVYSTINFNLRNQLRAEGMTYGDEVMAQEVDRPFDNITVSQGQTWTSTATLNRPLNGGFSFCTYSAIRSHVYLSPNSTNVQVRVSWKYKGTQYSHNLASIVSK